MQIDDVIRKINKLLAIAADPSASDQEIQLATYRAEKLMLKYKIENKDIINEKNSFNADNGLSAWFQCYLQCQQR